MKKNEIKLQYVKTVRESLDFGALSIKCEINRKLTSSHIQKVKNSIEKLGFLGAIIVVETKVFGKKELVIIDGQNRYMACMQMGIPINYEIHKVTEGETVLNVTKLISGLNTTAKAWSPQNFLTAFVANKIPNYIKFDTIIRETGFTITDLLHIYLGGGGAEANKKFKSGEMNFIDEDFCDEVLKAMILIKNYVPNLAMCRRVLPNILSKSPDIMGLAKEIKRIGAENKRNMDGFTFSSNQIEFEKRMSSILTTYKRSLKENKKAA